MEIPVVTEVYRWGVELFLTDLPVMGTLEAGFEWLFARGGELGLPWAVTVVAVTLVARMTLMPLGLRAKRANFVLLSLRPHIKGIRAGSTGKERDDRLLRMYGDNRVDIFSPLAVIVLQVPLFAALARVLLGESFAGSAAGSMSIPGLVDDIRAPMLDSGPGGLLLLALFVPLQLLVAFHTSVGLTARQRRFVVCFALGFTPFLLNVPVSVLLSAASALAVMVLEHKVMQRRMAGCALVLPRDSDDAEQQTVPLEWGSRPARDSARAA